MASQLRPTRLDVTDRFPMLGFTIRSDSPPRIAEVVIATDPALFTTREGRSPSTFYSSREHGALTVSRNEAVYVVPPNVLARFVAADRLWFGLATAPAAAANDWSVDLLPTPASPYVSLTGLSDRALRRVRMYPARSNGGAYGGRGAAPLLEWAGDRAQPGMTPVPSASPPAAAPGNGGAPAATAPAVAPAPADVPYDDGFGPLPPLAPAQPAAGAPAAESPAGVPAAQSYARAFEVDPESMGIEEPVADEAVAPQAMALTNRPRALSAAEYGGVTRIMPSPAYNSGRGGQAIDRIVIHITGAPQSPYIGSWFTREDANSSAHYLVDQNGEIIQFVREQDTSWHARGANRRSIGIEHVAIQRGGARYPRSDGSVQTFPYTPPTDAEYRASSALVAHLCRKYGLTPDRTTIIGHREADPRTTHSACPDGAWDWDAYMALVAADYAALPATGVGGAQGLAHARGFEVDPEAMGIDAPAYSENGAASALAAGLALTAKDYDRTSRIAPSPAFTAGRSGQTIDRIVIHITDAPTTSSTVNHFTRAGANSSAHYLVAQDGEIIQFVSEADTAWHARGANRRSVGIEHVAVKQGGATYGSTTFPYMPPTDTQYCESAALVSYLCQKYGLTPDRTTIIGHREADTSTGHTSCPDGAWNWDHFMDLVTNQYCAPQPTAQGLAADDWSINWDEVQLIAQPTGKSCWATAAAMLVGWRDHVSISPQSVAAIDGLTVDSGLQPADKQRFADAAGLLVHPNACYTAEGFRDILEANGPVWVTARIPGVHAIVVTGMYRENGRYYVRITDPLDRVIGSPGAPGSYTHTHNTGSQYIMTYEAFTAEFEAAGDVDRIQLLHTGGTHGHTINRGSARAAGYAQSLAAGRPQARALGADDWSINWDDVQLTPQPTDMSCWATAAAMLAGWRDNMSVSPQLLAEYNGLAGSLAGGLSPEAKGAFADAVGLVQHPNACYTAEGFRDIIEANGPVWVTAKVPFVHAIVVTGMYRENGRDHVRITDPLDRVVGTPGAPGARTTPPTHNTGSRYIMTYEDFAREFEAAGDIDRIQLLHTGGTHGHTINRGSASAAGYAQALGEGPTGGGDDSLGVGTRLTRTTAEKNGRRYDLAQLSGVVMPAAPPAVAAPLMSGERILLDDWPYIEGPSGRTQAGIAIDWQYQAGGVGNIAVAPVEGQVLDGWTAAVRADIVAGESRPDKAQLRVRVTTTFSRAGEEDQLAVSEVDLSGDGRQQTRHGADRSPAAPSAPVPSGAVGNGSAPQRQVEHV